MCLLYLAIITRFYYASLASQVKELDKHVTFSLPNNHVNKNSTNWRRQQTNRNKSLRLGVLDQHRSHSKCFHTLGPINTNRNKVKQNFSRSIWGASRSNKDQQTPPQNPRASTKNTHCTTSTTFPAQHRCAGRRRLHWSLYQTQS